MPTSFTFTTVLPPFAGAGQDESVVAGYVSRLEEMGGAARRPEVPPDASPLVLLIATGGTERAALALHAQRDTIAPGDPVVILAHPGNNSLPAALELLARLQQDGASGRIVYLRGPDDAPGWRALEQALHAASVRRALRSARIGLVGAPSDWLVASSPGAEVVRKAWGPEIVPVGMEELASATDSADEDEVTAAAASLEQGAARCVEPDGADLRDAARVYAGLAALVAEHRLDALTVRCFDIVMQRNTSGCFALSALTDSGIIAGCEGDLVSAVGMLWAKLLTGEVPWMANPSDIDTAANTLWLAHCTVPRATVETYSLRSHFESGVGVGIQGTLARGPVTLLRVGGISMERLWLAEGEITDTGAKENLCRTQARIALTDGNVGDLLSAPLGNHLVMIRGHHAGVLAGWHRMML